MAVNKGVIQKGSLPRNLQFMEQAELCIIMIPPFRIQLSPASSIVAQAVDRCQGNAVDLYADIRFPVITVAWSLGTDFKRKRNTSEYVPWKNDIPDTRS